MLGHHLLLAALGLRSGSWVSQEQTPGRSTVLPTVLSHIRLWPSAPSPHNMTLPPRTLLQAVSSPSFIQQSCYRGEQNPEQRRKVQACAVARYRRFIARTRSRTVTCLFCRLISLKQTEPERTHLKGDFWDWKDGSAIKETCCSSRRPTSDSR